MSAPTYGEMRTRAQRIHDIVVKERVLAGLAALQAEFGDAWVDRIDCDRLDLADSSRCVLGQVYGDYCDGASSLSRFVESEVRDDERERAYNVWAEKHGFYDMENEYERLQEVWTAVLCDKEAIPRAV